MFGNTHTDLRKLAYVLATILHECAGTWHPIEEFGKGKGRSYGKACPFTGKTYYGRGYVQLTWKTNYQTMCNLVGIDLVNSPERACEPCTAWKICSEGMRKGRFTGKRLRDYITDSTTNYKGARKIINGTDQDDLIAWYATKFQAMLEASI